MFIDVHTTMLKASQNTNRETDYKMTHLFDDVVFFAAAGDGGN